MSTGQSSRQSQDAGDSESVEEAAGEVDTERASRDGRAGVGEKAADDAAQVAEREEKPAKAVESTQPAGRWLVAVLSLAFVLLLLLIAAGFLLQKLLADSAAGARREAILSVAHEVAQRSYSLDYESFPQEASKIISQTTGNYRQGMIDSEKGLQHILSQGKVKSTCTITAAGVERNDDNTATVLLSITSRVTNTEIQVPQPRFYRVSMNLQREGDQWLVLSNDVIA